MPTSSNPGVCRLRDKCSCPTIGKVSCTLSTSTKVISPYKPVTNMSSYMLNSIAIPDTSSKLPLGVIKVASSNLYSPAYCIPSAI